MLCVEHPNKLQAVNFTMTTLFEVLVLHNLSKRLLTTQYFAELSLEFCLFLFAQVCSLW